MSEQTDHTGPPDDDLFAAEYVLGVLTRAERIEIERRLARDHAFADRVTAWEARLLPWAEEIASVAPSPAVWPRIAAALPAEPAAITERWGGLAFWRGWAIGASALAAASVALLVLVLLQPAPAPLMAALDGGGRSAFVATVDPQRTSVTVVPAALAITPGRVPELWLIAPGQPPRSIGLINAERTITIAIPANLKAQTTAQAVLAVSLEPPGGSPTGAPTGPVIAQGKLTTL